MFKMHITWPFVLRELGIETNLNRIIGLRGDNLLINVLNLDAPPFNFIIFPSPSFLITGLILYTSLK